MQYNHYTGIKLYGLTLVNTDRFLTVNFSKQDNLYHLVPSMSDKLIFKLLISFRNEQFKN